MQRVAIVTGVLGLGTALVFGAAFIAATLFPNGGTVAVGWNTGWGREIGVPMPMPAPEVMPVEIEDKGGAIDAPVVQVRPVQP